MPRRAKVAATQSRILIGLLTLVTFALIASVWWYYGRERESTHAAAVQELSAIAEMKCRQIENWRAERIGDGRVLAASGLADISRQILQAKGASHVDPAGLIVVFESVKKEFQYLSGSLVDSQARVYAGDPFEPQEVPAVQEAVRRAQSAGQVQLSDLYLDGDPNASIRMLLAIPVSSAGAIILAIDPSRFLYPYMQSWPTASRSGETFLVRRDGEMIESISPLRYDPKSALRRRGKVPASTIPDERTLDQGWVRETADYRGIQAISIVRHIRGSNWYLNAKIDAGEVYAPLSRLSWELALLAAVIALANAAGVGWIWRNQQWRAYLEKKALSGHFDSLTRYANDMILLLDENYRIVEANQRAVQAYGYQEEEMRGLPVETLLVNARRPLNEEPDGVRFESLHRRRDGSQFPVDVSARVLEVDGVRFCQCIIRDITERVRTQKEIYALNARLINAQEEERTRIARELHDDLSQQIAALSIGMSNLKRRIPAEDAEAREQGDRIQRNLVQVSEGIRRLSHELHPAVLEHAGLGAALRSYCREFSLLTGIRVECMVEGEFGNVPRAVALCAYRITQEALQNVAKHAQVNEAEVTLAAAAGELRLAVTDRGAGFPAAPAGERIGLGLVSIKERTRLVKGALEIESEPGRGTTVRVRIPV